MFMEPRLEFFGNELLLVESTHSAQHVVVLVCAVDVNTRWTSFAIFMSNLWITISVSTFVVSIFLRVQGWLQTHVTADVVVN